MSLEEKLKSLATAIGTDYKTLKTTLDNNTIPAELANAKPLKVATGVVQFNDNGYPFTDNKVMFAEPFDTTPVVYLMFRYNISGTTFPQWLIYENDRYGFKARCNNKTHNGCTYIAIEQSPSGFITPAVPLPVHNPLLEEKPVVYRIPPEYFPPNFAQCEMRAIFYGHIIKYSVRVLADISAATLGSSAGQKIIPPELCGVNGEINIFFHNRDGLCGRVFKHFATGRLTLSGTLNQMTYYPYGEGTVIALNPSNIPSDWIREN